MKCLYCQNSPWSWNGKGEDVSVERLAEILRELAEKDGCCNWNLVSPTPYLPFIREAAQILAIAYETTGISPENISIVTK